jgi:hypothetical protein
MVAFTTSYRGHTAAFNWQGKVLDSKKLAKNSDTQGFNEAIWDCDLSHYVFSSAEIRNRCVIIKMVYNV